MEDLLAANGGEFASPEGAANEIATGGDAPAPEAASAAPAEPPQGKDLTRQVARRIKEERQKARQELVTELFGSEEACAAYRQQQEQTRLGGQDLEESSFLAELALASDPQLGEHYLQLADQVKELAGQYGMDLESAFLLTLSQHLPELLTAERLKGEQQLLQKLSENAATPGSLQDSGSSESGLFALNEQEFADLLTRVKRGEMRHR